MSHFEYVSVAIALMYALLAGRLLSGLSPSLDETKRYSVHFLWLITLILVVVMQWWLFWRTSDVVWTPVRFLYALSLPAAVFVRAGVLLGPDPNEVVSFRDHFYEHRVPFFALGVLVSAQAALTPWVFGIVPWLSAAPIHRTTVVLGILSIAGVLLKHPTAQHLIVLLTLLLAVSAFYVLPSVAPAV